MRWHSIVWTLGLLGLGGTSALAGQAPRYEQRWFYAQTNLQVAENVDRLIGVMERAAASGYNGVVLADYKFHILDRVPDFYFTNVTRLRQAAQTHGIEIIPAIFPIGYSDGLLAHDPNLAEGLPVCEVPFLVRGSRAELEPLAGAGLEQPMDRDLDGDRFQSFSYQDEPGRATFVDRVEKHAGVASCRIEGASESGNRRLIMKRPVRPFSSYRLSAWVKTRGVTRPGLFRLLAIGAGRDNRSLTFMEGGIAPDQDWTRISVVFNSIDNDAVSLYAGTWGDTGGTMWIDDLELEGVGLMNVLRRPGCPLTITSEDGATVYEEGRDYATIADPKLGQVPYAGVFSFDHEAPPLTITPNSRIQDGQRLLVSWYHPVAVHGSQVMCCPSEPRTIELLRDQARRVRDLLEPDTYLMSHDEVRVLNWDAACQERHLTAGQILADNMKSCVQIMDEIDPDAALFTWSDMFDPHHNAVEGYYLVRDTLAGSWEGLPSKVAIANWNGGHKRESLEFFAGRGHRQVMAGYYDVNDLSGFTGWDEAARGIDGVTGFMYTTWQGRYDLLERYGQAMNRD